MGSNPTLSAMGTRARGCYGRAEIVPFGPPTAEMSICFVANKDLTVLFSDIARHLGERQEEIVWLSPSTRWTRWLEAEGVGDIVQLAGFVPDGELRELLQRAACVVIPSLYEPFGIVALEGMAAGAPTVVARTGGLAEIVDGSGAGLLFEPGNHHQLADLVESVLADPVAAATLPERASHLLRSTYTWDAIGGATVSVYLTTLAAD